MKVRSAVGLGLLVLLLAILAAALGAVTVVVNRSARDAVIDDLAASRAVFESLHAYRQSLLRAEARAAAEEPRLATVMATAEITRATVEGVAAELMRALQADLLVLTDAAGLVVADVAGGLGGARSLATDAVVARALAEGESAGLWTDPPPAFQVHARRLSFGARTAGVLIVGRRLGAEVAEAVYQQTGNGVVLLLGEQPLAAAGLPAAGDAPALARVRGDGGAPIEVVLGGVRHLAVAAGLPSTAGAADLRVVIVRSLDAALAPGRRLTRVLLVIGGAALLAAVLLALGLARSVARPLDGLVALTRRIAAGNLDTPAPAAGPREVRSLAAAMNGMMRAVAQSRSALVTKERLESELEIASRIQTALLPAPAQLDGLGFELAARLVPAGEVGGDYHEVVPVAGACWIGIGDIGGRGLDAGLVMLMVQAAVASLIRAEPDAAPADLIAHLDRVLADHVRGRLGKDVPVAVTLLRCAADGMLAFAGAGRELLLCPASGGPCERLATAGTTRTRRLAAGDSLALFSKGLSGAPDGAGQPFGLERLSEALEQARGEAPAALVDRVLAAAAAWAASSPDDRTLLILRRS